MKIPADALSPYLSESDGKAIAEGQRAGPVEGPARLRATLSHAGSERGRGNEKAGRSVSESNPNPGLPGQTHPDPPAGAERRKEERRKKDIPVMLDTRLTRRRRASSGDQPINFRI